MATTAGTSQPVRLTGLLAALVVLGVVMFAVPGTTRLWIAAVVILMALLSRGDKPAALIETARQRIYGK